MVARMLGLLLLLLAPAPGWAQQLLWESTYNPPGSHFSLLVYCSLTPQGLLLVPGCTRPLGTTPCQGLQQVFRLYDLSGQLVREQLGRRQFNAEQGLRQGSGSRYWWAGTLPICTLMPAQEGSYAQRLTLRGDTLPAWPLLAPVSPGHRAIAVLEDGRRLLVAGYERTNGANMQLQRYTLTSVDTASGQVRWRRAYDRLPFAHDYPIDLVRTPRGGYLLSGDGIIPAGGAYQHLLLETDSLGIQLKQRLIYPLGSTFNSGSRFPTCSNLLALPNAQGYLASGTADSLPRAGEHYRRAYLMRLDTALNVTWVYAHNAATDGLLSQDASKVRLLPDGSAALLVRDMIPTRNDGSANLRLVQIDLATGRHLATYALPSPSQLTIDVYDWQWLGDGTLVLCGESTQAGLGSGVRQGYLARWDFRTTPLATGRPATTAGGASLQLYPTPGTTTAPTAAHYQLPPGTLGGTLLVTDVLGRLVQRHPLPTGPRTGSLPLPGLPAGLYLVRLLPTQGPALTQRLLVQP